jgi:hypothetical protein
MAGLEMKYFVLTPVTHNAEYALASRAAMLTYADKIENHNPKLATDLRNWVEVIHRGKAFRYA